MTTRLFPLLGLVATVLSCSAQSPKETCKVRATVMDVKQLPEVRGTAERTLTPDSRFAVTLRIESVSPPLTGYTNGTVLSFAIPSPAKVGLNEASKGQRFDFVFSREVREGSKGPWRFEKPAVRVSQQQGPAGASQPSRSETNRIPGAVGSYH